MGKNDPKKVRIERKGREGMAIEGNGRGRERRGKLAREGREGSGRVACCNWGMDGKGLSRSKCLKCLNSLYKEKEFLITRTPQKAIRRNSPIYAITK